MVVLTPQSEVGYAPPPQTPYSIITNLPGYHLMVQVRSGDLSPFAKLVHIYPRFGATQFVAQLGQELAKKLGLEGKGVMPYLNPIMFPQTVSHATRKERGDDVAKLENLTFKCVDIAGHRLYVVLYEQTKGKALMLSWGAPGLGLSIRGAEGLLKDIDTMVEVPFDDWKNPPEPTWTPEGPAHRGLRERIVELLHRAPIDLEKVKSQPRDVFLYPTGMGAIFHATNLFQAYRPGIAVVLGVVFHNTYHHLLEESPHGWKHVGKVDEESIDGLEAWLEDEVKEGRKASFMFVEFPGNPTLDTPDLPRLKHLSEKYDVPLIVDDTIAGFGNVDVIAYSDILLTSLTKSFSGKSDVLGGSIVLNPLSPHYEVLSAKFTETHRNELFAVDAEVLLANSQDYFARTRRLNRNAEAVATFLHKSIGHPDSPVTRVRYPSLLPSKPLYDCFLRPSTAELPEPGYGCLFTVDFESVETSAAFIDNCGFYTSPHLGGHVSIIFAYNMISFGKTEEEMAYVAENGLREEGIRVSAGLEDVEDLIDTVRHALDAAIEVKKKGAQKPSA